MSLRSGETAVKVVSANVGTPREVRWKDKPVTTGIFKAPVDVRVTMRRLNLDGDRQADLRVHGGPSKAVYTYPSEHYAYWQREFPGMELPWGMFGENLMTLALLEGDVRIRDRFRVGSAEVIVTEPRMPCYKLGLKLGRNDIIKWFLASRRTGFYVPVVKEGDVQAGDPIEPIGQHAARVTVADITELYAAKTADPDMLRTAAPLNALPESWRAYFRRRLERARDRSAP